MDPETENQQEGVVEETGEEGDLVGMEVPGEEEPSFASRAAAKAGEAAERTGAAARRLLEGLGSKIESPAPPTDDLSDLFEGPDMDRDNDVYIKDLVTVDEEDVFGEGGEDMSDILEVTDEDVMGTEDWLGYGEGKPSTLQARRPFLRVVPPPTGLAGVR